MSRTLDFYYDVVCPYAWLASQEVEAVAAEAGVAVRWCPILLGGVFRSIGAPDRPVQAPARAAGGRRDLLQQAERLGIPLVEPDGHPRRTVDAMRVLVAAPEAARPRLTEALFRAYWVEGRDVAARGVLDELARPFGVDVDAAVADRDTLRVATEEAVAAGVFGVPTFRVGDRLDWGVDRLAYVREALGLPRRPAPAPGSGGRLVVWHDVASPFSYLACTQIPALAARHGAEVSWRPVLLGALFKEVGTPDVPMFVMNPTRRRWAARDLADAARWWGVPFRFPTRFPLRSLVAQRVLIQEPAATAALYTAAWAADRDVSDPAVVREVVAEAGFDPGLVERADAPEVKAALRLTTAQAVAEGVFGVPTVEAHGARGVRVFWGQDRLEAADAWLARAP